MGFFSWIDCCDSKKNTKSALKTCYVLVPEEFTDILGNHIKENFYDGMGHFGGYDIFELIAEWNKQVLSEELLEDAPKLEDFGGLYGFEKESLRREGKTEAEIEAMDLAQKQEFYDMAIERRERLVNSMRDYKAGMYSDDLELKYGDDWKREIGNYIAESEKLPYPIKITYNEDAIYEMCPRSERDPKQGE
ncbi:MAG: hypothetical protein E7231_01665 [Cellulosilyticum sp.]|jgi:hypothetical protein|nr:hypothetical protein [Cellulosilyticum sp.]